MRILLSFACALPLFVAVGGPASAQPKGDKKPAPSIVDQLGGKTLDQWVAEFKTAKDPSKVENDIRTILLFGPDAAQAALPHLLAAAEDSPRRVADMVNISSVAGRVARSGSGVYNLTKHGVGAFSEALRQEVTGRHVRVSLVEPGAVATELAGHNRPEVLETMRTRFAGVERMQAEDIADAVTYIVTRPRHVAVNELLIRPTEQEG